MIDIYKYQSTSKYRYGMLQDTITKNWKIPDVQPLSWAHTQHPPIEASSSLEPPEKNNNVGKCKGKQIQKSCGGGGARRLVHKPNFGHRFFFNGSPLKKI